MTSNRRPAAKGVALRIGTVRIVVRRSGARLSRIRVGNSSFAATRFWNIVCLPRGRCERNDAVPVEWMKRAPFRPITAQHGAPRKDFMPLTARYAAAQQVALKAGELARDLFAKRDSLIVEHKGAQNFVSRADRAVEDFIASKLKAAFSNDAFLGEESAAAFAGTPEHVWVVDPIDGTHNFLRGLRYYCVSIAYVEVGQTEVGVVYDPEHDEMFHARRGEGAWRRHGGDQGKIAVSDCAALEKALLAIGHHDRFVEPRYLALRHALMDAGAATRNLGAGALQLAHVAAGRLAGLLLVEEAGGYVAPFPGPDRWREPAPVLGCAPGIAGALRSLVGAW